MFISLNAFVILWLTADADDKLITKRHKEMLNLLAIDEIPSYDWDIDFLDYESIRWDENVKEAYSMLTNQQKKLAQTFFWMQLFDSDDEAIYKLVTEGSYYQAYKKWNSLYKKTKKTHYLKNALVLWLLIYENNKRFEGMSLPDLRADIIDGFQTIIEDKSFWKQFKKIFDMHNDIPIQDSLVTSFAENLPQSLADGFFQIGEEMNNYTLYKDFIKEFNIQAKNIDNNQHVKEIINNVESNIKTAKELDLSDDLDGVIDLVNQTSIELKQLDAMWLGDNNKVIVMKDTFAKEIRSFAISLFNDHDDPENAKEFLEESIGIASSSDLRHKISSDINDINDIITQREGVTELLQSPILLKELSIPISQVKSLIDDWWRFVAYKQCISPILVTYREHTEIYFIPPGVSWISVALSPTLLTLFFGWWWFPFWPIYTLEALFCNVFWWKDFTNEIMDKLG